MPARILGIWILAPFDRGPTFERSDMFVSNFKKIPLTRPGFAGPPSPVTGRGDLNCANLKNNSLSGSILDPLYHSEAHGRGWRGTALAVPRRVRAKKTT